MENKYYIYFHVNISTGKVFYVGKGSGNRAWSKSCRNKYWHRVVNKYDYLIQLFEENLTEEEAYEREMYWITYFGKENLVNMTNGGDSPGAYWLGKKLSQETKNKISKIKKYQIPKNKGISKYANIENDISLKLKEGLSESQIRKLFPISKGGLYRLKKLING